MMPGIHPQEPVPAPPRWWQVLLGALCFGASGFVLAYLALLLAWPRGM